LGRRYARADEIGIPFAVTVDFETLVDSTVTLRERDSMQQIRLPKDEVTDVVFAFVHNKLTWEQATHRYPVVTVSEDGDPTSEAPTSIGGTVVVNTGRGRFRRPAPQ
jgi:glycyl-tRNA synthetase